MKSEIIAGSRVRVTVNRNGSHYRNFNGTVKGWTRSGKLNIVEDGKTEARTYSSDNVKLIRQ